MPMHVLLLSTGSRDPENAIYTMVVAGLQAAGQQVYGFDPFLTIGALGQSGAQRLLRQTLTAHAIDWILCFPPYDLLEPATVAFCREHGIPIVGLRYDDAVILSVFAAFPTRRDEILLHGYDRCDLYATSCVAAHERLHALGATRTRFWTLPIASETYPYQAVEKRYAVTFVGSAMAGEGQSSDRLQQVESLLDAGIDVHVWGSGWQDVDGLPAERVGGRLPLAGMQDVFRQSWLSLTPPGNYHGANLPMVKFRNLEVASVGGVQVQQRCADMDAHFRPGVEYLAYDDPADIPDLVAQALQDPQRLLAMGQAAAARVRADHDWRGRVAVILDDLAAMGRPLTPGPKSQPSAEAVAPLLVASMALGHLCERAKRPTAARDFVDEVLRYEPTHPAALAARARLDAGTVAGDEAEVTLVAALEAVTASPVTAARIHAHVLLGHLFEHRGDWNRSVSHFQAALALAPGDAATLAGLARIHEHATPHDPVAVLAAWQAVGQAQAPTRHHHALRRLIPWPSYGAIVSTDLAAEAAYRRLLAYEQQGDWGAAAAEAPLLTYAVPGLMRQHALLWIQSGQARAAEALYAALHADWPEDARILNEWGAALGVQGDLDAAEVRFRQALALDPTSTVAQNNLRQLATLRGQQAGVDPLPPP